MLKKLLTVAAASTIATLAYANAAQAIGFNSITIGDEDGFGFENIGDSKGAYGGNADINGDGILGVGDVLPDITNDGKLSTGSKDNFDNRDGMEKGNSSVTTMGGFKDNGSSGSMFTDISLSTSFLDNFYGTNITPLQSVKADKVEQKRTIQSKIDGLNEQMSGINSTIKPLNDQITSLREQRDSLPRGPEKAGIQADINKLKENRDKIKNEELNPLKSEKDVLVEQREAIKTEIEGLNTQIDEMKSEIAKDPNRSILDENGNPMTDDEGEMMKSKIPLPIFTFDFEVAQGDIAQDSPMYFNLLFGDYDVKDAMVEFTRGDGSTFTEKLTKQKNKQGQDGLIQAAYAELDFDQVFSRNENGDFDGKLTAKIMAADEPYLAFDYAQLSTDKVLFVTAQDVPEPTAILGFMAFGAYGAGSALKRKKKS